MATTSGPQMILELQRQVRQLTGERDGLSQRLAAEVQAHEQQRAELETARQQQTLTGEEIARREAQIRTRDGRIEDLQRQVAAAAARLVEVEERMAQTDPEVQEERRQRAAAAAVEFETEQRRQAMIENLRRRGIFVGGEGLLACIFYVAVWLVFGRWLSIIPFVGMVLLTMAVTFFFWRPIGGMLTVLEHVMDWVFALLQREAVRIRGIAASMREEQGRRRMKNRLLAIATAQVTGCTVLVMIIVGYSLWPVQDGSLMDRFIAVAGGFFLGVIFYMVEGFVVRACAVLSVSWRHVGGKVLLLVFALLIASISGALTFSKFYWLISRDDRISDARTEAHNSMQGYLGLTREVALKKAESCEDAQRKIRIRAAVTTMEDVVEKAKAFRDHEELKQEVDRFKKAGSVVAQWLPVDQTNALNNITAFGEPSHTALGASILGAKVPGVSRVYLGAVLLAIGITIAIDFSVILAALFLWIAAIVSRFRTQEQTFRIVSLITRQNEGGSEEVAEVVIDGGAEDEISPEVDLYLWRDGRVEGHLTALRPLGRNAFYCATSQGTEFVTVGDEVRLTGTEEPVIGQHRGAPEAA